MSSGPLYPERPPPSIDPTLLTTEQLHREIGSLANVIDGKIDRVLTVIEVLGTKMEGHWALDLERFSKVDERFMFAEQQRLEQKNDTRKADEDALKAQKEAVTKSEAGTSESINKLSDTFTARTETLSSKIDDLKERVGRIESARQGAVEQRTEGRANISVTAAVIGSVVAVVGIALALLVGHNTANTKVVPVMPQVVTVTSPSP